MFQPIADALARWVSCYGIAAFLLTGSLMERVASEFYRAAWIEFAFTLMWLPAMVFHAYKLDAEAPCDVMPEDRIVFFLLRILNAMLPVPFSMLFLIALDKNWIDKADGIGWIIAAAAFYFMACRKHPPAPKRFTYAAGKFAEATE